MSNHLSPLLKGDRVRLKFNDLIGAVVLDEQPNQPVVVQFRHGGYVRHSRTSLRKLPSGKRKERKT